MGIDAGFDMVPALGNNAVDREKWLRFIASVKAIYKDDEQVRIEANGIHFHAGEHPILPFEGHKFRRFSSKISGSCSGVYNYLKIVRSIARQYFGSQIAWWDQSVDQYGFYDWTEVHKSIKSYDDERDEPEHFSTSASVKPDVKINSPNASPGSTPTLAMTGGGDPPLFKIISDKTKGRGLYAREDIPEGTRILLEEPLFVIPNAKDPDVLEKVIASILRTRPRDKQRQFLSLHNSRPRKHPFGGIVKTNALPCGPGASVAGVYPTICLINHSCIPNAHANWNSHHSQETVHAIREIKKGDEITISYCELLPYPIRFPWLKSTFGFDCSCSLCSLGPTHVTVQASDARRVAIQRLDERIGDTMRVVKRPHETLADCRALADALLAEFDGHAAADAYMARLWYDAFKTAIGHGDQARARIFADRSYRARVICEGEDSPAVQKYKALAREPTSHEAFGAYSSRWKTAKTMIPKGLNDDDFERWLFREHM